MPTVVPASMALEAVVAVAVVQILDGSAAEVTPVLVVVGDLR